MDDRQRIAQFLELGGSGDRRVGQSIHGWSWLDTR
jgi:hypothetical protein